MPLYFGMTMCIFEGNGMILSFYAEVDKPNTFMRQIGIVLALITALGMVLGTLSYLAFGDGVQQLIIYNLPQGFFGTTVKMLYMFTIMGIYVLVLWPVF